jgi:hypothetical protein
MAYKIQELVESGFDFSQVYPEKQQAVRESTGLDFDLAGVVKFLQRQTNNFTTENPVAKDLDNAVFVLVEKWKSESGTPKAESVEDADKEVEKELKVAEKTEEEKQAEIREAIEVLELLGDELDEEQKDALEILKSLLA